MNPASARLGFDPWDGIGAGTSKEKGFLTARSGYIPARAFYLSKDCHSNTKGVEHGHHYSGKRSRGFLDTIPAVLDESGRKSR
jgi:hypothetical protein